MSHNDIASTRLDVTSCFLARILPSISPALCYNENLKSPKVRVLSSGSCPELWTYKISPRQVDRVVNKTRRRSSLLNDGRRVVAGLIARHAQFATKSPLPRVFVDLLCSFHTACYRPKEIRVYPKNGTSFWIFVPNSGLSRSRCQHKGHCKCPF